MGLFSPRCVQCGKRMPKKADYCPDCGTANKGSWRMCGNCGSSVGAGAGHCWNCGHNMPRGKDELFGDRWRRDPEDFAIRFPLRVPKEAAHGGIQVDEGTRAFLMVNGRHDGTLKPGYHVMTSFIERLVGLGKLAEHSWAMLVNSGPQMLEFPVAGLRDAEQVPLNATVRVRISLRDPERFLERVMIHHDRLGNDDLVALIGAEFREVVQKRAAQYRLESLIGDVVQREGIEKTLRSEMARVLEVHGLEFNDVRLANLSGPEVERLRERMGAKAVQMRDWEVDRELKSAEREQRFKDFVEGHDYGDRNADVENRRALRDAERARELRAHREQADELQQLGHQREAVELEGEVIKARGRVEREEKRENHLEKMKRLEELRKQQMATLDVLARQQREGKDADAARKIELAKRLSGIAPEALAAASAGEQDVIDALVKLTAVQSGTGAGACGFAPGVATYQAPMAGGALAPGWSLATCLRSGGGSEDQRLQAATQAAMPAVALLSLTSSDGDAVACGTGWMLGPRVLATNAHVAADARQAMQQGLDCWAVFGGPDGNRNARVEQVVIHPKYGDAGPGPAGRKPAVPPYDVALMVLDADQPGWLELAPPEKLGALSRGTRVAYLGYPMEDMAGGGVNSDRPEPIMKSGIIAAMGDWWLGRAEPNQQFLIQHDLGVAGGASGSPLLDIDGHVVGIVSAGNMAAGVDVTSGRVKRIPSGVLLNFAQRIDLLGELLARQDEEGCQGA